MKSKWNFRRYILINSILLIGTITLSQAQTRSGFGFKAGLNYSANGDYIETIGAVSQNPDRNIGYHFGIFGKLGSNHFLKPELVYTKTTSDYSSGSFHMQKLDAPVLAGLRFGPVSIFAGPAFQYILDTEFENIHVEDIESDFTVGLNVGVGFNLNRLGIDLRYERGFGHNEAIFLNENGVDLSRIDTRPDQLILSLSLLL